MANPKWKEATGLEPEPYERMALVAYRARVVVTKACDRAWR
jgi:hypothetical protein